MAYIGIQPAEKFTSFATQEFSTSATTSYTLDHAVANENEIALFVNNVRQQPGSGKAYTASGTALTLSAATASTDTMYCIFLGRALQTVVPATNSITAAMMTSGVSNGVTEADMFRLTADTNQNTAGFVTSNWERVDTDGFGKIGTGLTESSGVFSFPSTGFYLITGFANMDVDGSDTNAVWELYTTADNSSYDIAAAMGTGEGSGTAIRSLATIIFQLDVTNTTNVKFKWATSGFSSSTQLRGNTALNETCFSCIRLGDT